ncbi:transcriptional regulatory pro1 [Trichoderma arundinaceum]|uniref:Transcriptional regulatory pro1 n=1 Tax=Trichoderma arundinaceum TaxID=490622 RepID=A0A395NWB3_TRIAR|nr:transcriptional regulatory pro1 [Trichoderma arundinaceum]
MVRPEKRCDGCWTCRLRRKKCDEARPICTNCGGLQITCHYGTLKPEWLDGAEKQEAMAAKIRSQIKQQADYRRERHHASARVTGLTTASQERQGFSFINLIPKHDLSLGEPTSHNDATSLDAPESSISSSQDIISDSDNCEIPDTAPAFTFANELHLGSGPDPGMLPSWKDFEMNHLMKYLDHVFPFLFPFYPNGLLDPGRGWIFPFLGQSKVAFHSVISISSYFFTVAIRDAYAGREHELCRSMAWSRLIQQADMCFDMLQQDIQELNDRGGQADLLDKVRVMESIVQFLTFEIAVGRSANWDNHLSPTLALFRDILQDYGIKGSKSLLFDVLNKISLRPLYAIGGDRFVWDNRQECFRFFTGLLLFIDVVASTSLDIPPRLLEYHPQLLTEIDDGVSAGGEATIRLSHLTGCHNWVIRVIAEISALDAWKKENKSMGSELRTRIIERARHIARILEDGMSRMGSEITTSTTTPTRIWAHSAKIYLAVVASGWQPLLPEVRSSVAQTLQLLQTVVSSSHLRVLAWPLCIAGCMAEHAQEQDFRNLFVKLDKSALIGTLGEALRVMESTWQNRESMNSEAWDIEACLNILGTPVLLV